ncbi:MAG: type III pantothenate kinase [Sporolactobacillus sp.]
MLFACDVGNTHIVLGAYDGDQLTAHWRVSTDRQKTEDEYAMLVSELLRSSNLCMADFSGAIISTVVPSLRLILEHMFLKYFHLQPLIVGVNTDIELAVVYDNPSELGADRLVNAVAAIQAYEVPLIIIDFGTATTYCYIDEQKRYVGGAISPGVFVSAEALYTKASKLPRIEVVKPPSVIAGNTIHAMQSGLLYGYVGQVEGIVKRMKQQMAQQPTVIATGGLCRLIANETDCIDVVDPFLTLKGLYLIYCHQLKKRR